MHCRHCVHLNHSNFIYSLVLGRVGLCSVCTLRHPKFVYLYYSNFIYFPVLGGHCWRCVHLNHSNFIYSPVLGRVGLCGVCTLRHPKFVYLYYSNFFENYTTSVTARNAPSRDNCTTRIFFFISAIKSVRSYAGCVCSILSANAA